MQGENGNDALTVDSTNGAIPIPVTYDGGDEQRLADPDRRHGDVRHLQRRPEPGPGHEHHRHRRRHADWSASATWSR